MRPMSAAFLRKFPPSDTCCERQAIIRPIKANGTSAEKSTLRKPDRLFTREMDDYGFSDFFGPGDIIGHTLGGYHFDHLIAGSAVTWLRRHGQPLSDDGKPWALTVGLVNPHDVMYFNTDTPGQSVQDGGFLMMHAARAPNHPLYQASWNVPLPESLSEPLDAPGRPMAHGEFQKVWNYVLGHVPPEQDRWRRFNDYYVNCIRSVDTQVDVILKELELARPVGQYDHCLYLGPRRSCRRARPARQGAFRI